MKNRTVQVRVTADEAERIRAEAERQGRTVSDYGRRTLLAAVKVVKQAKEGE